jgi:hypothetical protein
LVVVAFQQDIRLIIPSLKESLRDSDMDVREATVKWLSGIAAQGMYHLLCLNYLEAGL